MKRKRGGKTEGNKMMRDALALRVSENERARVRERGRAKQHPRSQCLGICDATCLAQCPTHS